MTMTPDAKKTLSSTIRALRARLQDDLTAAVEATYRLSIPSRSAALSDAAEHRRTRLEDWVDEQLRAEATRKKKTVDQLRTAGVADRLWSDIVLEAGATWLNRLVLLRLMEAASLRPVAVLTGGWESSGYKQLRDLAPALVHDDPTEGYAWLLQLVFEDLAVELPGLFGDRGLHALVPMPPATLRHLVETLDDPALASCWTDDMTLGWVYQYWNDPAREALDEQVKGGHKIRRYEISAKTQMFTDRYLVEWLLQNSLGPMWLAMCKKHRWTAEAESSGTLDALNARRVDWRAKRDAGEASLTELMPLHTALERRWAYYLPQPLPDEAVEHAADSVRDLRLLDPAVGSGHFLIVAFDLLFALYREEAQHRGETGQPRWTADAIVQRIVGHNLAGIDLDPRAVQIAAAGLWLKAKQTAPGVVLVQMNLVASRLSLASLPKDDPALEELRQHLADETGIPARVTDTIVAALEGADHLGSLLRVDAAVDQALDASNLGFVDDTKPDGLLPFKGEVTRAAARVELDERLEAFLARHTSGADLGLQLRGRQLTAGVRFIRMLREASYDLVVMNPPYHSANKLASDALDYQRLYPAGRANLFAAFGIRGNELVKKAGLVASVTLSNWMFLKAFSGFREFMLSEVKLRALADLGQGSFSSGSNLISASAQVFQRLPPAGSSIAQRVQTPGDTSTDSQRFARNAATMLCQSSLHTFCPPDLKIVPEWPVVYWWDRSLLERYSAAPKLGQIAPVRIGLATGNNSRFIRTPWEIHRAFRAIPNSGTEWVPYIKGGGSRTWYEPMSWVLNWALWGLEDKVRHETIDGSYSRSVRSESMYFRLGVAFSSTGSALKARLHRFPSAFDVKGQSVFHNDRARVVCLMNSATGRYVLESFNPTVSFQAGDGARLPFWDIAGSGEVCTILESSFEKHESHREASVEFLHPGPSPWRHAQDWAQAAVDRPDGAPLPEYVEQLDPEPLADHVSYVLGVVLGRFHPDGTGIVDPTTDDLNHALPAGTCFLDGTLDPTDHRDSLGHPTAAMLHDTWATHGPTIADTDLRTWLRTAFFKDVHRQMYDNRPIHFPLSSSRRTFVAWVTIHRWTRDTLRLLLADHLHPALTRLDGELADLRAARDGADTKAARAAERRYAKVLKWHTELTEFLAAVEQCAEKGAPPTDAKCPEREQDARYAPDLNDGVMINSAALWPLLTPQWKDPKRWWKEVCTTRGRKDYAWAHLAMRYWSTRVDKKCQEDPSLGVAHGCFWRYHPERAWAWELRLQDEIAPHFRIEEAPYRPGGRDLDDPGDAEHRATYLRTSPEEALNAVEKELGRRIKKSRPKKDATDEEKAAAEPVRQMTLLEPGLWTARPEHAWAIEVRAAASQDCAFSLDAPDAQATRAAFLREHPEDALAIVAEEAEKLRKKTKGKLASMHLPGPELREAAEAGCTAIEADLTERQRSPFRLCTGEDDLTTPPARPNSAPGALL